MAPLIMAGSLLTTRRRSFGRALGLTRQDLDLAAFFQCALAGDHHALAGTDTVADLNQTLTLISEFYLGPLGGIVLRNEDVVLAVLFDQRTLGITIASVLVSVRISTRTNAPGRKPGFGSMATVTFTVPLA